MLSIVDNDKIRQTSFVELKTTELLETHKQVRHYCFILFLLIIQSYKIMLFLTFYTKYISESLRIGQQFF